MTLCALTFGILGWICYQHLSFMEGCCTVSMKVLHYPTSDTYRQPIQNLADKA